MSRIEAYQERIKDYLLHGGHILYDEYPAAELPPQSAIDMVIQQSQLAAQALARNESADTPEQQWIGAIQEVTKSLPEKSRPQLIAAVLIVMELMNTSLGARAAFDYSLLPLVPLGLVSSK